MKADVAFGQGLCRGARKIDEVPKKTAPVAQAAFPKNSVVMDADQ
ncbi:hypothetical protein [Streptomyces sp. NBC_00076]